MSLDLILRQGRLTGSDPALVDIGVSAGRIVDIAARIDADAAEEQLDGRLVIAGFVETHIHLDKSCILERCNCERGTLEEAIETVAAAKRTFTEADIHARAQRTLEKAIIQGTTRMRTHVEADPRVGLNGFHAVRALKRDYAWALDLEICVFPQEGLTNDPGTEDLLIEACEQGADVIGGCPYTDTDPAAQTARIFAIAHRFDLDIDFHLDFDLDPSWMHLDEVCRQTDAHRWGGRVAIGHVTKLSTIDHSRLDQIAARLADAGVAVTVLPATDLFVLARHKDYDVPRCITDANLFAEQGCNCSISTNNILNPFTPFGDGSLLRMANLHANILQVGRPERIAECFEMLTSRSARLMNLKDYGIAVGNPADVAVLEATSPRQAVAELREPLAVFKGGKRTVTRRPTELHRPD
jgi:cytosine deaminase